MLPNVTSKFPAFSPGTAIRGQYEERGKQRSAFFRELLPPFPGKGVTGARNGIICPGIPANERVSFPRYLPLIPEPSFVFLVGQPFKDNDNNPFPVTGNRIHQPPAFKEIVFPEIIDPVPGDIGFGDLALWDLDPTKCIESKRIEDFV